MKVMRWILAGMLLLTGCARTFVAPDMAAKDLSPQYQSGKTTAKVDGFLVLLDASSSMTEGDGDYMKFDLAKSIVDRMNRTLPPLAVTGGLRGFGHEPAVSKAKTQLFFGMAPYQRAAFKQGLDSISMPGGTTPMAEALKAAAADLKQIKGKMALIMVSDGQDVGTEPLAAANALKNEFGDRLCIYTVHVGEDAKGAALMQQIASVTPCGAALAGRSLNSADAMTGFVQKVFLAEVLDSDGDGVPDNLDQCPNTPAGTKVDDKGCPVPVKKADIDSDDDGVLDSKDRCPGTPKGAKVNAAGCWVLANVFFDTNKADIKPDMRAGLDEALQVLKQNPAMRIEVQGHTDSDGKDSYNQALSEKRARAVADYFRQQGIAAERISSKGYGESQPVADNKTKEGKAQNRRVELKPL